MSACPENLLLERYAEATCTPDEAAAVEQHVTTCEGCRRQLGTARGDQSLLSELRAACAAGAQLPAAPRMLPHLPGYRVLRVLGAGGMGVVYEAEQETPRRRVALKVMRAGTASTGALRRFELEREVLARLEHPGIARIHAAGTYDDDGEALPFFAMELVEGEPLDAWLRRRQPPRQQRLRLFAAVCAAVEHAHRRGVVHRDLKPGNVLVTAAGEVKVVDFGVARLTDGTAVEPALTSLTAAGQAVGTLPYMSPEQVRGDPDAVDTRTDVWALGVLLFQMLSGRLPHDLAGTSRSGAGRRIAQTPAMRLGAVDRTCRGDLETIAAKALSIDPDGRYASAGALGDDVARLLRHEPIVARPPGALYQLRKLARRHRLAVAAGALVLLAFAAAFVVARFERDRALQQANRAEAVVDILKEVLLQADPAQAADQEPTIREAVREAERRMQRHIPDDPWVEGVVRHTLGLVQTGLGDYEDAQRNLDRAAAAFGEAGAADEHEAAVRIAQAELALYRGRYADAETLAREALAIATVHGPIPAGAARAHNAIGLACHRTRRLEEAGRHFRQSLALWQRMPRADREPETALVLANLGQVLMEGGDLAAAMAHFEESLAITRTRLGEDSVQSASMLSKLAVAQMRAERFADAEETLRRSISIARGRLGAHHPELAPRYYNLGYLLVLAGRHEEAAAVLTDALQAARRQGEDHETVFRTLPLLAGALRDAGRPAEAVERLEEVLALARGTRGEQWPGQYVLQAMLVITRDEPDRDAQLEAIAAELRARLDGADEASGRALRNALVRVYELWERPEEAARLRR